MEYVVPKLCETNNFSRVVELAMMKIERLEQINGSEDQIILCQNIVLGMFAALNKSIISQKDWKILESFPLPQSKKQVTPYQKLFNKFYGHFQRLKDSDDYQKKI